jgi:hypothetical protein
MSNSKEDPTDIEPRKFLIAFLPRLAKQKPDTPENKPKDSTADKREQEPQKGAP